MLLVGFGSPLKAHSLVGLTTASFLEARNLTITAQSVSKSRFRAVLSKALKFKK
jgi:hypothetical protein